MLNFALTPRGFRHSRALSLKTFGKAKSRYQAEAKNYCNDGKKLNEKIVPNELLFVLRFHQSEVFVDIIVMLIIFPRLTVYYPNRARSRSVTFRKTID